MYTLRVTFLIGIVLFGLVKCNIIPNVIIVGAGASGIAAAAKLLENNINNITILEIEKRIGGRIHSVKFGDTLVDLGAQWCHGEANNIVYEKVKYLNLLEKEEFSYHIYHASSETVEENYLKELYELFEKIYYYEEEPKEDVSVGEYFIKSYKEIVMEKYKEDKTKIKTALDMLDMFEREILSADGGFSWFDIAAKTYYVECEGDQSLSWKGTGFQIILDILMKKYPNASEELPVQNKIHFNKEVAIIEWDNPNRAIITCLDGSEYIADFVIFTPSLGVLKQKHHTLFRPSLPEEKISVINELSIGAAVKVFLHFPKKWWFTEYFNDSLFSWSEEHRLAVLKEFLLGPRTNNSCWLNDFYAIYHVNGNPNVLEAWFSGPFVPEIELLPDNTTIEGIMFVLNKFLGKEYNITKPEAILRSQWYSNPHFYGTYSFETLASRNRSIPAATILSEPLIASNGKPRLLFAGEATHTLHFSTVHGAIESGYREADRIINLLKDH